MAKEGVQLDKDNINKNPGLRLIAKLCLNSFWGKFGQRNNLSKTEYVDSMDQLNKITCDDTILVTSVLFCGEDVLCVKYDKLEDHVDVLPNTSPVVAAFTTAYARLKLYSCLQQLVPRVLYMDTDSVVYTVRPGEWRPEFGEQLEQMTNELEKDYGEGDYCSHFLGAGPKNYGLKIKKKDGEEAQLVKVKGLTRNHGASQKISFDSIRELMVTYLENGLQDTVSVNFNQISKDVHHSVTTKHMSKNYMIVYNKRQNFTDGTTQP